MIYKLIEKHKIPDPYCMSDLPQGWVELADKLIQDLVAIGWDKELHQCKEKFGALRWYVGTTTPEMDALIEEAEKKSMTICLDCGSTDDVQRSPGYWIAYQCKDCRNK